MQEKNAQEGYKESIQKQTKIFYHTEMNRLNQKKMLNSENFPQQIQHLQSIQEDLQVKFSDIWKIIKYTNGIKIYKQDNNNVEQSFTYNQDMIKLVIGVSAIFLFLYYFVSFIFIIPFLLSTTLFFTRYVKHQNIQSELSAIITINESQEKLFSIIKGKNFKLKWDFLFKSLIKVEKKTNFKKFVSKVNLKGIQDYYPSKLKLELTSDIDRFKFLHDDSYFLVDISKSNQNQFNQKINSQDMIILRRFNHISGRCAMIFYSKLESNTYTMSKSQLTKMHINRMKSLALLRESIQDERLQRFFDDLEDDKESEIGDFDTVDPNKLENILINQYYSNEKKQEQEKFQIPSQSFQQQIDQIDQLKSNTLQNKPVPFEDRKQGYRIYSQGGIECFNQEELKSQEGLLLELLQTVGKNILEGKNIVSISLPIRIFEPRSLLERLTEYWAYGPIYLSKAAMVSNPLERFKLVMAFGISGIHNSCKQLKPFNPILGETFQGYWPDGTEINVEHTSHHPPISNFLVIDYNNRYKFYGRYLYKGQFRNNAAVGINEGPNIVEFENGQKIIFTHPKLSIGGLVWGSRIIEWIGDMTFKDEKNDFQCNLKLYDGGFFQREHRSDYFEGQLTKISDPNFVYHNVKGSILENLMFDDVQYWNLNQVIPAHMIKNSNPIPSDCRFRSDLIYLLKRDQVKAQEHKIKMEILQRADRTLRIKSNKSDH